MYGALSLVADAGPSLSEGNDFENEVASRKQVILSQRCDG